MIIDSATGTVKPKPTTGKGALASSGESVWGEGLVAEITAHGLSRGRSGQRLGWYNPGLKRAAARPRRAAATPAAARGA